MTVVIVVNPIYVHQSLLTTSGFSLVELPCQSAKQASPTRRLRFLPVRWVLRNCQRSVPHGVLQLQWPWVILPTCKWRPREQSRLSQGHAVRGDIVAPTWHCLQDRGSRNSADACRMHLLVLHLHLDRDAGRLHTICLGACYGEIVPAPTQVKLSKHVIF